MQMAESLRDDSPALTRKRRVAFLWFPLAWLGGAIIISVCLSVIFGGVQNLADGNRFMLDWFAIQLVWVTICQVAAANTLRIDCPSCGRSVSIARAPWPFKREVSCGDCGWRLHTPK